MTDTTSIDVAPLLERHDRKSRRTFAGMLATSLVLSAIIFTHAVQPTGSVGQVVLELWNQIMTGPLIIGSLWIASAMYGRKRPSPPDGRLPMNADDARNATRVAKAGYVFVTGFGLVMIVSQAFWVLSIFGVLQWPIGRPDWGTRAVLVAVAALMIYFGNVSPRMPTPRTPEAKPAVRMKYNRLSGWMCVIFGALLALAALFLPSSQLTDAVGGLGITLLFVIAVGAIMYRSALSSRTESR